MAVAPVIAVAVAGSVIAGVGNGIESVAARTALQEEVEPQRMALMMGFNESMFQLVPGLGILLGGAIASLAGPRVTLGIGAARLAGGDGRGVDRAPSRDAARGV